MTRKRCEIAVRVRYFAGLSLLWNRFLVSLLLFVGCKPTRTVAATKQLYATATILDCQREISGGALPVFGEPAKLATIERTTGSNLQRFTVGGISKLGTQCRVVASPQD